MTLFAKRLPLRRRGRLLNQKKARPFGAGQTQGPARARCPVAPSHGGPRLPQVIGKCPNGFVVSGPEGQESGLSR